MLHWCYRLRSAPDSSYCRQHRNHGSEGLHSPASSLGTFFTITCFDMLALSPCIVYTANALHVTPCVWVKCQRIHKCIQTVDLKGAFRSIRDCSSIYLLLERPELRYSLPPQPLLVHVPQPHFPRGHLPHFLHIPMELLTSATFFTIICTVLILWTDPEVFYFWPLNTVFTFNMYTHTPW